MSHIQTNFTASSMAGIAKDVEVKIVKPVVKTAKKAAAVVVEEIKKVEETVVETAKELVSEVETATKTVIEDVVSGKAE